MTAPPVDVVEEAGRGVIGVFEECGVPIDGLFDAKGAVEEGEGCFCKDAL